MCKTFLHHSFLKFHIKGFKKAELSGEITSDTIFANVCPRNIYFLVLVITFATFELSVSPLPHE